MKEVENWKDVPGFEGYYQASTLGNVKTLSRKIIKSNKAIKIIEERLIKPFKDKDGYLEVSLWKGNKGKKFKLHRLIGTLFIPNPENKPTINHKFGDKKDNKVSSLEWATRSENISHAYETGLLKNPSSKRVIHLLTKVTYNSAREAANANGYKDHTLTAMLRGVNKNTSNMLYL